MPPRQAPKVDESFVLTSVVNSMLEVRNPELARRWTDVCARMNIFIAKCREEDAKAAMQQPGTDVEEVVQGTREPPKKRRKYASEEERKEAQRIARNERRKNIRKAKRQERESEVFKEAQAAEAFPAGTTIDDALRQVLGGVDVAEEGRQAEEKPKISSDQEKKKRGRPPKAKADDKDAKTEENAKATEPQKAELDEVVESDTPKKKRRQFKTDEERREAKRIAQNERRRKAKEALKQAKESEASKESLAAHSPQADASVASAVQQVDMVDDDIEVVEEVRHFEADGDIMTVITL